MDEATARGISGRVEVEVIDVDLTDCPFIQQPCELPDGLRPSHYDVRVIALNAVEWAKLGSLREALTTAVSHATTQVAEWMGFGTEPCWVVEDGQVGQLLKRRKMREADEARTGQ